MVLCTDLIGLHLDKLAPSCPNVTLLLSHYKSLCPFFGIFLERIMLIIGKL